MSCVSRVRDDDKVPSKGRESDARNLERFECRHKVAQAADLAITGAQVDVKAFRQCRKTKGLA